MTLEAELAHVLLAIKDAGPMSPERYGLIYKALALATMCGYGAGIDALQDGSDWFEVVINLPTGQVSFTVPYFVYERDGHTTEDKYRRIAEFMKSV